MGTTPVELTGNVGAPVPLADMGHGIARGLQAIGSKLAEFGRAIAGGFAAIFRSVGRCCIEAEDHARAEAVIPPTEEYVPEEESIPRVPNILNDEFDHVRDEILSHPLFQLLPDSIKTPPDGHLYTWDFLDAAKNVLENDKVRGQMEACDLTIVEATVISLFATEGGERLFGADTNPKPPAHADFAKKVFASGLAKLEPYESNRVTLPGDTVRYRAWYAGELDRDADHLLVKTKVDLPVAPIHRRPSHRHRAQLLLKPGARDITDFNLRREARGDGKTRYLVPSGAEFQVKSHRHQRGVTEFVLQQV